MPARNNCLECSAQYSEYRQSRVNCRPVYERLGTKVPEDDRLLKIDDFENQQRKRFAGQGWIHDRVHDEEADSYRYVWQKDSGVLQA